MSRVLSFFRAPRTIVGLVLSIAVSGVLMTVVPQVTGPRREFSRFVEDNPRWAQVTRTLQLDRVARAPWFLGLVGLAAISLGIVVVAQWRRLRAQWRQPVTELTFRGAGFRRQFERAVPEGERKAQAVFRTRGRAGLLGSPLFHLGLLLVVTAGLLRMLFGSDAMVDLFEGETLAPAPEAYGAQWQGPLAAPFALSSPVRLEKLVPERYASGEVRRLAATATVLDPAGSREVRIEVNTPLDVGGERLFLTAVHGPAVFVELAEGERSERRALLLRLAVTGASEASAVFPDGHEVRLRAAVGPEGELPAQLEVRVLRWGALLLAGRSGPGEVITLPSGPALRIHGVRYWAQFGGTRDHSVWLAYAAFLLLGTGATLMFMVVKVDTARIVTPTPTGVRVVYALKAQRFGPLFSEEFEALVREGEG